MINKIKNFFLRICSFFYSKSTESEHEKRYATITRTYEINLVDKVQEKTSNENIVSDNPVEFKQNSVKNTLNNKWVSGHKKIKKTLN
jgi:hypothetical protein